MKETEKNTNSRRVYNILHKAETDPYWWEGINFYPQYRRGFKNSNHCIMAFQVRMYRTWKHNRKTKYKQ